MNNNYYQPKPFYNQQERNEFEYSNNIYPPTPITEEQLYIDSILRQNHRKKAKIYVTIPGSIEWQDKTFEGIIESTGKDHIILSNPNTGEWHIIPMIYLNFITIEEPINYKTDI